MDTGLPLLNCLWQQALRSFCSPGSSKWVYAVFWRVVPRNFPPPRWDNDPGALNQSKGIKRNWILVWEDGFCDFYECERVGNGLVGKFGSEIFFKMSHEVYNYGEGLVGKVAADNTHKWVYREASPESDPPFSCWNGTTDPPKAWELQFYSGIQTIAIIAVREGVIQLGSLQKVAEDLSLLISIQRKFSDLQSLAGAFSMQRPYAAPSSDHYPNPIALRSGLGLAYDKEAESPKGSADNVWKNNSMSYSLQMLLSRLPSISSPQIMHGGPLIPSENIAFHHLNLSYGRKPSRTEGDKFKPELINSSHSSQSSEAIVHLQQQLQVHGEEQGDVSRLFSS